MKSFLLILIMIIVMSIHNVQGQNCEETILSTSCGQSCVQAQGLNKLYCYLGCAKASTLTRCLSNRRDFPGRGIDLRPNSTCTVSSLCTRICSSVIISSFESRIRCLERCVSCTRPPVVPGVNGTCSEIFTSKCKTCQDEPKVLERLTCSSKCVADNTKDYLNCRYDGVLPGRNQTIGCQKDCYSRCREDSNIGGFLERFQCFTQCALGRCRQEQEEGNNNNKTATCSDIFTSRCKTCQDEPRVLERLSCSGKCVADNTKDYLNCRYDGVLPGRNQTIGCQKDCYSRCREGSNIGGFLERFQCFTQCALGRCRQEQEEGTPTLQECAKKMKDTLVCRSCQYFGGNLCWGVCMRSLPGNYKTSCGVPDSKNDQVCEKQLCSACESAPLFQKFRCLNDCKGKEEYISCLMSPPAA